MTGFVKHRLSRRIHATFAGFEADLLRSLAAQLVELVRDAEAQPGAVDPLEALLDFSGPTTAPEDPVLARLFPTAYRDDEDAAADFRRFTESTLRDAKARAAAMIIDTLTDAGLPPDGAGEGLTIDVELEPPAAEVWLRALADLRLALGTRLEVTEGDEEAWAALPEDDPRAQMHHVYDWLGYLQETLVRAL